MRRSGCLASKSLLHFYCVVHNKDGHKISFLAFMPSTLSQNESYVYDPIIGHQKVHVPTSIM